MAKAATICCVAYCRKPARASGGKCHAHAKLEWAERNPIRYAYNNLRTNARRRGKVFELTLEQFEKFAVETDYINKRGRGPMSYTIDRKDPTKGYTVDNIQVMTNAGNVRKYARIDSCWNGQQMDFFTIIHTQDPNPPDVPF